MGYLSHDDIHAVACGLVNCWSMMHSAKRRLGVWIESLLHSALHISTDALDNSHTLAYAPYQEMSRVRTE